MTRESFHRWIDKKLDEMGFEHEITIPWGHISFTVKYADGKAVLKEQERRDTEK